MRWHRAVLVLVLGALSAPAHAELWASSLGDLLKTATRIEIVHVDKVSGSVVDGSVVESVRGSKVGDAVHIDLARLAAPAIGDRVLIVCDQYLCPRAAAVDRGRWFQLAAREMGDGAFVTPSIVEAGSLAALAAGRAAPDLCMLGTIRLLDERFSSSVRLVASAADGHGTGTVDSVPITGTLSVPWYGDERGIELRVATKAQHALAMVAETVQRAPDHCYDATYIPTEPFVRTSRGLTRALAGTTMTATVIARATLEVGRGAPVAAGSHAIELSVDDHGQLAVASDLAQSPVREVDRVNGHLVVGFSVTASSFYPLVQIDLGPTTAAAATNGAAAATALAQLKTAPVTWKSLRDGKLVTKPLGTASITYVRER